VHHLVGGARALAVLADLLLVPLELGGAAVVEVAQRDGHLNLDVVAAALAGLVAEVAAAAEEAAEEVEGVMRPAAAALLALLEPLVPVLVVDLAGLGVGEGLVGFGDEDELVVGCRVVAGEVSEGREPGNSGGGWEGKCKGRAPTGSCRGGISCLIACRPT
jgi:hypothetical protein